MTSKYQSCIDACLECSIQCSKCSTECLKESDVQKLARCIQLERECSMLCLATAHILSIEGRTSQSISRLCTEICTICADECEKHPNMQHCKDCAETCRRCAMECDEICDR